VRRASGVLTARFFCAQKGGEAMLTEALRIAPADTYIGGGGLIGLLIVRLIVIVILKALGVI
jgi:hypothetical protein